MKKRVWANRVLALLLLFTFSCDESNDPSYTSLEGEWVYVTPDKKISITFEMEQQPSSSEYKFRNVTIVVDGTEFTSSGSDDPLNTCDVFHGPKYPTSFSSFSFVRYTTAYDYQISMSPVKPNAEFTEMTVAYVSYMFYKNTANYGQTFMENSTIRRSK